MWTFGFREASLKVEPPLKMLDCFKVDLLHGVIYFQCCVPGFADEVDKAVTFITLLPGGSGMAESGEERAEFGLEKAFPGWFEDCANTTVEVHAVCEAVEEGGKIGVVVEQGVCEDVEAEDRGEKEARDTVICIILLLLLMISLVLSLLRNGSEILRLFGEVCEGTSL